MVTCWDSCIATWGKANDQKPQLFSLSCPILAFLFFDSQEPQPFGLPCNKILVFLNEEGPKDAFVRQK